ncbi:hypothetical protein GSI_04926 [Ganoderma sinense ZZ0214-1]|uniref:Uncharacterized protein n=1 Tax=Ganoderma sinense ZZ0214-1 TaxID=1077348 RepID=A0A2G8SGB5_9APHY|nr:hypothetical protein GSI_04926 [Ganoderma sinense ZZ0214-1]
MMSTAGPTKGLVGHMHLLEYRSRLNVEILAVVQLSTRKAISEEHISSPVCGHRVYRSEERRREGCKSVRGGLGGDSKETEETIDVAASRNSMPSWADNSASSQPIEGPLWHATDSSYWRHDFGYSRYGALCEHKYDER